MEAFLDVHHGCESRTALGAHLVSTPGTLDSHAHAACKVGRTGAQYAIRVRHGFVELARHVVVAAASAALDKHLGAGFAVMLVVF
jgi:hypothetical protein